MKNTTIKISTLIALILLLSSCAKEHNAPAIPELATGKIMTIADVRAMYVPGQTVNITEDISVYGVVTMDETTGNLYKESYITDETGNLYLRFISGSGLYTGDSIQVNLNGSKIIRYNQMLQVDSLHPDNNIVKIGTQQFKTPEIVSINSLINDFEAAQGQLIELENVRFVEGGLGLTYADAANQTSKSRYLQDLGGTQIEVRTSGYANFANDTLPSGVGSFYGIVAQYNSGLQLLIRDPNELTLSGQPPVLIHEKNFNDQSLTSGGWSSQTIVGPASADWGIYAATNSAAKVSNYDFGSSSAVNSESWLISPSFDLSTTPGPFFSFKNVVNYALNPEIQVLLSTNYDGTSNPNTATWVDLSSLATLDNDDSTWSSWTNSGNISLSSYTQSSVYVAFKLAGTTSSSSTWEIDDIKIYK